MFLKVVCITDGPVKTRIKKFVSGITLVSVETVEQTFIMSKDRL